ncbi:MAG: flagellar protein FlaG [Caldimicrobium sp.]
MKVELYKNLVLDQILTQKDMNPQSQVNPLKKEDLKEPLVKLNKEKLKEIAEYFKEFIFLFDLDAKIVYDKKYQTLVVQVFRKDTGEIIKQIPPEELLRLSQRLQELVGILLQHKV